MGRYRFLTFSQFRAEVPRTANRFAYQSYIRFMWDESLQKEVKTQMPGSDRERGRLGPSAPIKGLSPAA